MDNYLTYRQKIVTAVDEFDFLERIKPSAILEYFQDLASIHADEIGVGFEEMKARNLCWVLNRVSAIIDKQPTIGEELYMETFPHKPGMVDAIRDYHIRNAAGESLIRGTSRWCVLDFQSKAIRKCSPLFKYDDGAYQPEFAMNDGNPQLPEIDSLSGQIDSEYKSNVNITDLDRNGHANNARYGDIIVNSCDFNYYSTHSIKAFDFNFMSEMKIGNSYAVKVKTRDNISYFEANGNTRLNPIFRARILWN